MNTDTHSEVEYCARVEELYAVIQQWLPNDIFEFGREKIWLNEEGIGEYFAEKLILKDKTQGVVATLVPIGALVIGAEGRVDLNGKYDAVPFLWLRQEDLKLALTPSGNTTRPSRFFNHIHSEGWYWIEDPRRGKAHHLNSELLRELLWQVSDYVFD